MELTQQESHSKEGLVFNPGFDEHKVRFVEVSFLDYRKAWDFQRAVVDAKINNTFNDDVVMVLEHPPVITIGRHAKRNNLLVSEAFLDKKHIRVIPVDRGGDVTYHGPGQLVVYLLHDLKRAGLGVKAFVEKLEEVMLRTSADAGVPAVRNPLNRGAWVGHKKIGSVGIAVRKGVSYHGFALNVNPSVEPFQWINPCGLDNIGVTTLQNERSHFVAMKEVRNSVKQNIRDVLNIELIPMDVSDLKDRIGKTQNRKPGWLKRRLPTGPEYETVRSLIRENRLHTVCQQAKCPNQFECYSQNTATFLILGNKCTRNCRFCAIEPGPKGLPDPEEPQRVAEAAASMNLDHVVVTSVTRDDLTDGGAMLFANTIRELRKMNPDLSVEVLIPDFQGDPDSLKIVLDATPDVLNHNIETVPRLYKEVRPEADYHRSLWLLNHAAATSPATITKSGIMLGLGEGDEEIEKTIQEVYDTGCSILTIGQYLQPSKQHLEVRRYIHPGEFNMWRERALNIGFAGVASGPFVRSSYHARQMFLDAEKKDTNENTGH